VLHRVRHGNTRRSSADNNYVGRRHAAWMGRQKTKDDEGTWKQTIRSRVKLSTSRALLKGTRSAQPPLTGRSPPRCCANYLIPMQPRHNQYGCASPLCVAIRNPNHSSSSPTEFESR
jgi:hypothetical protein